MGREEAFALVFRKDFKRLNIYYIFYLPRAVVRQQRTAALLILIVIIKRPVPVRHFALVVCIKGSEAIDFHLTSLSAGSFIFFGRGPPIDTDTNSITNMFQYRGCSPIRTYKLCSTSA